MKCLIVTTHFLPLKGGAQTVYHNIAAARPDVFSVLTAKTDYVTGQQVTGWQDFDLGECSYAIHRIDQMRLGYRVKPQNFVERLRLTWQFKWLQRALKQKIASLQQDQQFTHICIGQLDALCWLTDYIKQDLGLKLIVYTHGEEISMKAHNQRAEKMRHYIFDKADKIIAVSRFTQSKIIDYYRVPKHKVSVLHNGVRARAGVVPLSKRSERFKVITVGRLVERKGVDMLLKAWVTVLRELPSAQLDIIGDGPMADTYYDLINALGLAGSVRMLGELTDQALQTAYNSAQLFVQPNRRLANGDTEGFGLVLLEAASYGLPAIAGRDGGTSEAVQHGQTGFVVDGCDLGEIAAVILTLLQDQGLRYRMSEKSLAYSASQSWASKAEHLVDLLSC